MTLPARALRALRWPFAGNAGLRGGWRVLIFVILFILGSEVIEHLWPHARGGEFAALPLLGRESLQLLLVVGVTLLLGAFERRSLGDYGLPLPPSRTFAGGLALGFGAASALLLALAAAGTLRFALALPPSAIAPNAIEWAIVFLLVGLFEELLLRGYAQATLARSIGFWPAAVLLSVLFALAHFRNPGETVLGLVSVWLVGLFLCYTLRVTGSLWMAVGFHASWDWAESFFYGVPNSGTSMAGHLLQATF